MGMEITTWRAIRGTHLAATDTVSGSRKRRGRNFRMKASARNGSSPARRAVVTGGAGFLGSHLCIRLLDEGFHVTAIDNLSSGSLRNVAPLLARDAFRFIKHDIIAPIGVEADFIFNMACCASPPQYQRDPEKTLRTCTDGALNMLRQAMLHKSRIFQASTSEVYGEPEVHPQRENYRGAVSPIGPRACYDEGKRAAEAAFFDFQRMHGVQIKVARIFNTFGPQMQLDDGRVSPTSSCRRCATSRSPCTATAARRARSATWMT